MRGTLLTSCTRVRLAGLIPTYAGNTSWRLPRRRASRAHPHVCGEHTATRTLLRTGMGSSPRMRGTPTRRFTCTNHQGLIPTYAGNTFYDAVGVDAGGAHPHVCGEHWASTSEIDFGPGSSPRMRGTPVAGREPAHSAGLIPTYAGNTQRLGLPARRGGAHPHVCGEHSRRIRLRGAP